VTRRLAALEALGRGIANVRANLELVGVSAGGSLAVIAVVVLTMVPWIGLTREELGSVVGVAGGSGGLGDLAAIGSLGWRIASDLWQFLLALTVGLTLASILFSWYFGGLLGVLVAADAQAPPGPGRSHELFRTWSWRFFVGESGRLTLRVLYFYTICLTLLLVAIALFVAVVGLAVALFGGQGLAGLAVTCGAMLPFIFLLLVTMLAISLGQVSLVAPRGGAWSVAWRAAKSGYALLGRRLGAALGLFVLFFCATMAVAGIEAGASFFVTASLAGRATALVVVQSALFVVELMIAALLNLVLAATYVALVRGEPAPDPAAA